MIEAVLERIRGDQISGFSFVKYAFLGLDSVILHISSEQAIKFKSKYIRLGPYEACILEATECPGITDAERIGGGWTVGGIDVIERQDWLEPAAKT
jgi:hypothetical protein